MWHVYCGVELVSTRKKRRRKLMDLCDYFLYTYTYEYTYIHIVHRYLFRDSKKNWHFVQKYFNQKKKRSKRNRHKLVKIKKKGDKWKKGKRQTEEGFTDWKERRSKSPKRLMGKQMNIELVSEIEFKNDENGRWSLEDGGGRSEYVAEPFVMVIKCLTRINYNWIWWFHTTDRYAAQRANWITMNESVQTKNVRLR